MPSGELSSDTIAAVATAPAPALRVVIRLSGPGARSIAGSVTSEGQSIAKQLAQCLLSVDGLRVPGTVVSFAAPASYTGEDVVELHVPGSPWVVDQLMRQLLAAGVRLAGPGEFTARAFLNGKLDLTQAEGVMAAIGAETAVQSAAAGRLLAGELSRRVALIVEPLAALLALVEADIDFSDQDITFTQRDAVYSKLHAAAVSVRGLIDQSTRITTPGALPTVAFMGLPNAGKSTLLNALAGHERAVVSPVAGTTRDAVCAEIDLPGGRVRIVDVAGLTPDLAGVERALPASPQEQIDLQMRAQASFTAAQADLVAWVKDVAIGPQDVSGTEGKSSLLVFTKSDLISDTPISSDSAVPMICVSALTGASIPQFRQLLSDLLFAQPWGDTVAITARHIQLLQTCGYDLSGALSAMDRGPEFIAHHLRAALDRLGEITGVVTPDDVLGKIFAGFCIGK